MSVLKEENIKLMLRNYHFSQILVTPALLLHLAALVPTIHLINKHKFSYTGKDRLAEGSTDHYAIANYPFSEKTFRPVTHRGIIVALFTRPCISSNHLFEVN